MTFRPRDAPIPPRLVWGQGYMTGLGPFFSPPRQHVSERPPNKKNDHAKNGEGPDSANVGGGCVQTSIASPT